VAADKGRADYGYTINKTNTTFMQPPMAVAVFFFIIFSFFITFFY